MSSSLIGQKAPDFTLPTSDGESFSLSELDGQWKVLFFYARDGSPTCKRGCLSFKEQHDLFQSLTPPVEIIGISQDSAKDHDEFKKNSISLSLCFLMKRDWSQKPMAFPCFWVVFLQNPPSLSGLIEPFTIAMTGCSVQENMWPKFWIH